LWALPDEDLMHRVDGRDARAFGVIFDRHAGWWQPPADACAGDLRPDVLIRVAE
jgi:hypothetical protein